MRGLITAIIYIAYLYFMVNMIIDIETFGDFLWFVFIGSTLLAVAQFILVFIVATMFNDED